MKYLSQYIKYNVKDINTAVDTSMRGYCYCSGLHDLHIYVSHFLFWVCHAVWHVLGGNCVLSAQ